MAFTFEFIELFWIGIYHTLPVLLFLCLIIVFLGQIVGILENWNRFDTLYWSFITALTVGYGDMYPLKRLAKALSIIIGLVGFMLTGIIVAITVHAATRVFEKYVPPAT